MVVIQQFERRGCAFGQYKVKGTVIGLGLCAFATCGLALGWLGTWGRLMWVPLLVLGFLFIGLIGHFLLFLLPILVIQGLVSLWSKQK